MTTTFPIRFYLMIAAMVAAAGCAQQEQPAQQQPAQLRKITINYPNRSGSQWPLFLAKEGGFYEKHGLDVELTFGVHPAGIAMLASSQAQMVNSSLEQMMQAAMKDGTFSLIGSSLNRGTFALMADKKIADIKGLKGKRVAVSQVGDAPYGYVVAILSKAGLSDRDVQWIPVGQGVAGRAAALTSGRADATLLTAPAYFKLEADYNTLANLAEREDVFASTAYTMAKKDLQPDTKLAEALIKAHAEAIKKFYEDKPAAIAAYRKYDPDALPEDVDRTYDLYARPQAFERVPYTLKPAVDSVINQQAADAQLAEQMKTYDWKQVIDNSIVDRLVTDGFFVQLFGDSVEAEQDRKRSQAFGK
jgi:ABC-type nitrate/sulfonate/bicarbonate transport system substrate-binding protein